eukprot:1302377-Pyramimonas_sp.AAC.1
MAWDLGKTATWPGNNDPPENVFVILPHITNSWGVHRGVMVMLSGVTDKWYLNTGTVLGNGVMASCSRV